MSRRYSVTIASLAAALVVGGAALAQVSASFDLSWHVAGAGGGRSASAAYTLRGTAGQALAGLMASGAHQLSGGFWLAAPTGPSPAEGGIYLPLVLRR